MSTKTLYLSRIERVSSDIMATNPLQSFGMTNMLVALQENVSAGLNSISCVNGCSVSKWCGCRRRNVARGNPNFAEDMLVIDQPSNEIRRKISSCLDCSKPRYVVQELKLCPVQETRHHRPLAISLGKRSKCKQDCMQNTSPTHSQTSKKGNAPLRKIIKKIKKTWLQPTP